MHYQTHKWHLLPRPHRPQIQLDIDIPDDAALLSQAFMIDELIAHGLPRGWTFENGYFQLEKHPMDYWEARAGCLLRHHLTPRRQKMSLDQLPRDAPFLCTPAGSGARDCCL